MDPTTAREVATIRSRTAAGAAAVSGVLAVLTAVLATTSPSPVRGVLVVGAVLAVVSLVGCLVVRSANRTLEADPGHRSAVSVARTVLVGEPLAWLAGVVVVLALTGEVAWVLMALGLVVLVLPAVVVAALTVKGPHPRSGAAPAGGAG